ncbi:MAG: OPT/YSL family transporter, partial [Bryobacteraceae bacterium]
EMLGVPALIFALGMYLPLELNTPALAGGALAHFVSKRGRTPRERGIIIASGLMAGGALGGVFGAALRLAPGYAESLVKTPFFDNDPVSQTVSAALFAALCLYVWFGSNREKEL